MNRKPSDVYSLGYQFEGGIVRVLVVPPLDNEERDVAPYCVACGEEIDEHSDDVALPLLFDSPPLMLHVRCWGFADEGHA